MSNVLYVFRRDYRLEWNEALAAAQTAAAERGALLYCAFIFNPKQALNKKYASAPALKFLCDSLVDLGLELEKEGGRLHVLEGDTVQQIAWAVRRWKIGAIYLGADYTPFSLKRDVAIERWCEGSGVELQVVENGLLLPVRSVLTKEGGSYKKFTPFSKAMLRLLPKKFEKEGRKKAQWGADGSVGWEALKKYAKGKRFERGGRKEGLRLLRAITKEQVKERNMLEVEGSLLSPHIRFGTLSMKECYNWFVEKGFKELVQQLIWREFYTNVIYDRPEIAEVSSRKVKWVQNAEWMKRWKEGRTGVPLVDAGMRELAARGRAHNRVRMVVASFLIYNLGLDWREASAWYSTQLVDSDNYVNNLCNWIWVSGTESFSQDYYKIMSPVLQTQRFDPDCAYVKKWLPELEEVPARSIVRWEEEHEQWLERGVRYVAPMVRLKESRAAALRRYKAAT